MHVNAHNDIIHSSWKVETTQMSIKWSEDKESRILFSHKSEWSSVHATVMINIENTMHAKWNKTPTEGHIWFYLYDYFPPNTVRSLDFSLSDVFRLFLYQHIYTFNIVLNSCVLLLYVDTSDSI